MAAIRLLKEKLKNLITQAEKRTTEYMEGFLDRKPKSYIDIKAVQLLKSMWDVELFALSIVQKILQLRIKLDLMNKQGITTSNEAKHLHQYECFSQTIYQTQAVFLERTRFKLIMIPGAIMMLPIAKIDHLTFNNFL